MHRTIATPWPALVLAFATSLMAQPPNSVTITDQSGSLQSNRPFTISRFFAQGDIPHFAQASVNGTMLQTQCDVKTRWPDGSVQHALMSFLATVPANRAITVAFSDQSNGNNAGAMSRAAMLAASWGAQIEITNGTMLTANALQIITDWDGSGSDPRVQYWLQGPICTQVILEDRTPALSYDLGWDTYKSLHPIFVVTFYPGYPAGTKIEMILENDWTTKQQDQSYSLNLRVGNPLGGSVYSKSNFTHIGASRWRKTFWSGIQPGAVNVDFNLPYMAYSKVFPNWDLTKTIPAGVIAADVKAFNASDKGDLGGYALWQQNEGQTGGRPDIGIFPAWYVRYLYTMDPGMYALVMGMAEVSGYVPGHGRESDPNRYYDSGKTVKAFGLPYSLDARPSDGDRPTPVGTMTNGGWTPDIAHEPGMTFVPYVLTGDWYFLEEEQFHGSSAIRSSQGGFCPWCRGDSWGYMSFSIQTRGKAWGLRDLAHAAFLSVDGSPQKNYFIQKLDNNIQIEEGYQSITNGSFPPKDPKCPNYSPGSSADKWCYGNITILTDPNNNMQKHFTNTLGAPSYGDPGGGATCIGISDPSVTWTGNPAQCYGLDSPWMMGYLWNVMGHIQELGFSIGSLNQVSFKFLLHMIQDPNYNPYLVGAYRISMIRNTPYNYYISWADVLSAYNPNFNLNTEGSGCPNQIVNLQTYQGWVYDCGGSGDSNTLAPGYPHIMKGAASYLAGFNVTDGALSGTAAWNWMLGSVGYQNQVGVNPQYAILPRGQQTQLSSCDLNYDGVVNAVDVQLAINQALGATQCTNGDLDGDGVCTVIDVQRVINAALGGQCRVGS